MITLW